MSATYVRPRNEAEKIERRLARYPEAVQLVDEGRARPKVAEAVRLLRDGLTGREIAERMGLSLSMAYQLLDDPTDDKNRARKANHGGTCESCGAPTSYGKAGCGPSRLCDPCYRARDAERNEELLRRWEAGESGPEIAVALGMTHSAVLSFINVHRRSGKQISRRHRRHREAWPTVKRLWNQGRTSGEIARQLGTTPENVFQMLKQMRCAGWDVPRRRSA